MPKTDVKLRFGIALPRYPAGATVDGVVEVAQAAQELGFTSAWTTDHVILPREGAGPYESIFEPLMTLAYVAGKVDTISLGISVIVVPQRNGIVLAKELATLDHLCGGRLVVGVGAGWNETEFQMLGYGDRFKVRGAHLDETIEVWRHLWSTPEASFSGDFYELPSAAFGPKPYQEGGPPIWVGGASVGARKRAGRIGAAWHPVGTPAAEIEGMMEQVVTSAAEAGRPAPILAPRLPMWVGEQRSGSTTSNRMQVLSGDPHDLVKDIQRYENAGAREIVCLFGSQDSQIVIEQMERFSKDVMPAFV